MKRVLVVANKSWEAAPLVSVLLEPKARPRGLEAVRLVSYPAVPVDEAKKPRLEITSGGAIFEIWCLQDLMSRKKHSSSTEEKARVLPRAFAYRPEPPDLVIAFGTAGFPANASYNGSVVLGTGAFVHDPFAARGESNPASQWSGERIGEIMTSKLAPEFFREIDQDARFPAEGRFIRTPLEPGTPPRVLALHSYVALGIVNVTNYDDYSWADRQAVEAFERADVRRPLGSIETTHAIIRLQSEAPFLFVSGITDRLGHFDMEVTPRAYAQNFAAAHNAGVAMAWLIPEIVEFFGWRD